MNLIQKNPNDPKYSEFHDGEYEYWPVAGSTKGKSISIPAAVVSGLELIAAAAATGLLALAISAMYVTSAPRAIDADSAIINANVYNNSSDVSIGYSLVMEEYPDFVWQEGALEGNSDTLVLDDLNSGTVYLLQYFDGENNEIGEFRFATPGDYEPPEFPQPQQPQQPQTPDGPEPEVDLPDQPDTDPEEIPDSPEPEEIPPEEPELLVPVPDPIPTPTPPAPKPPKEDKPKPSQPSATKKSKYIKTESGLLEGSYFEHTVTHRFVGIPDDFGIDVRLDGEVYADYTLVYTPGSREVTITDIIVPVGSKVTTTVHAFIADGTEEESTSKFAPPVLDEGNAVAVAVRNDRINGYDFTVTVPVLPEDADQMKCSAMLTLNEDETGPKIVLSKDPATDSYVGTFSVSNLSGSGDAYIEVSAQYIDGGETLYKDTCIVSTEYGP